MRLFHTADWHLGHQLYGVTRDAEHAAFLSWLLDQIRTQKPDALVVCGDLFDQVNPPLGAIHQFHDFLHALHALEPRLSAIFIAGNHDSAQRLATSAPLLRHTAIRLVGPMPRHPAGHPQAGQVDHQQLVLPLMAREYLWGFALAVPFLRLGDLALSDHDADYPQGVAAFYAATYRAARQAHPDAPLIALGHGYFRGGTPSPMSERALFIGGADALPTEMFPDDISYVALGHLHRPQTVADARIRYAGSPIPLSFSEIDYRHQVLQLDFDGPKLVACTPLLIPRRRPLLRIPPTPQPLATVLTALDALPTGVATAQSPLVAAQVAIVGPEADLKGQIAQVMGDKAAELATIERVYLAETAATDHFRGATLAELTPAAVFAALYRRDHGSDPTPDLWAAFQTLLLTDTDDSDSSAGTDES